MSPRLTLLIAVAAATLAGCRKDEVHAYRVPKDKNPPMLPGMAGAAPGGGNADATAAASAPAALQWTAPETWQELPAAGMRRGSFTINGDDGATADLSVIAFPGEAGGLASNLNRWRGQIGLPALDADAAQATVEHLDTPSFHIDFVDYVGTAKGIPTRIAGAILHYNDESWFFKLMGPDALVAAETPAFRTFLQTVAPVAQP